MPWYVNLQVAEQDLCQGKWSKFFFISISLNDRGLCICMYTYSRVRIVPLSWGLSNDNGWTLPPCLLNFLSTKISKHKTFCRASLSSEGFEGAVMFNCAPHLAKSTPFLAEDFSCLLLKSGAESSFGLFTSESFQRNPAQNRLSESMMMVSQHLVLYSCSL